MSGILRGVDAPEQWRERFQREQHVRHSLRVAAERLESAEEERLVSIAAAHQAGLSVRQIAAAVRLSPARVHQLLHAPVSSAAVRATTMRWESSSATQTGAGSVVPLAGIAAMVRECTDWMYRLDREEFITVNLNEASDPQTEYVAADRAQVRQVLLEIAGEIEGSGSWKHTGQRRTGWFASSTTGKSAAEARPAQSTPRARATRPPSRSGAMRLSRKLNALA